MCFAETYAVIHPKEKGKAAEKEGKFVPYGRVRGSGRTEVNVISSIIWQFIT